MILLIVAGLSTWTATLVEEQTKIRGYKEGMILTLGGSVTFPHTSKHSGALMSSKLTAPKDGSSAHTMAPSFAGSFSSISRSTASMPANFLKSTAL
jgi:hypothetical protein